MTPDYAATNAAERAAYANGQDSCQPEIDWLRAEVRFLKHLIAHNPLLVKRHNAYLERKLRMTYNPTTEKR